MRLFRWGPSFTWPRSRHAHAGLAAMSSEVATGINIAKAGSDPPLRPDSELPEWLWPMARPGKSLSELRRAQGELEFEDVSGMLRSAACCQAKAVDLEPYRAVHLIPTCCSYNAWASWRTEARSGFATPARPSEQHGCALQCTSKCRWMEGNILRGVARNVMT